jgi:hypothetical protein
MTIDLRLHRDQKHLALAKLAALPEDHPLREKYELWIRDLDISLGESVAAAVQDKASIADRMPVERPQIQTKGSVGSIANGVGTTPSGRPSIVASDSSMGSPWMHRLDEQDEDGQDHVIERLRSENQLLRILLERFDG